MCEPLLSSTLEGKVQLNILLKWLISGNTKDHNFKEITRYKCSQSDFISFFLNYIHETQTSCNKNAETPQKVSTPKRLEQVKQDCGDNEATTVKSRSNLFGTSEAVNHTEPNKFIECTPKIVRTALDESYASPLSPLYNRQNFTTPKEKYPVHSSPKVMPSLCLGDFMTYSKSSSKKKTQRNLNENIYFNCEDNGTNNSKARRINPTNLNQRKCNTVNFRKSSNSFTFRNEAEEIVDNCDDQRSFLVEERIKILSRKNSGDNLPLLAVSKALIVNKKNEVVPLVELVMFKQQLEVLVLIYSFLLDHSFVLNLTSELYFLVSVLLSKEYEDDESPNNSLNLGVAPLRDDPKFQSSLTKIILKTIHNRIYFSTRVLEKQTNVLQVLDRSILRLLIENRRLQLFSSHKFVVALMKIQDHKIDRLTEGLEEGIQTNVCFISDTDNRDNFPSDPSFHSFRKQRDLFYETLRLWENNHLQNEWNFVVALGGKIRALLNMHADPANLVHFARLFKAQLLMSTCGKNANEDSISENQLSFLSSIPNVNAEKLSRLKSRIVSKQTCSGINSPPTFTGYQEFYRDFLLVAASHAFNRHLNDALISEMIELNDTKFNTSDLDDASAAVDSATQKSYLLCLKSLRILAKFLGFLESLPYKSDCAQLPANVVACQVCVRNRIQPSLNLRDIVKTSAANKNLTLTIPWVTKYLAMLDYVTLRLPYYGDVVHVLFELYHACSCYTEVKDKHITLSGSYGKIALQSMFLVKFCLGWLFELPHFPDGQYYVWLSQNVSKNHSPSKNLNLQKKSSKALCLDELDIVDQNVLHVCCPYLQEIKTILSNDASLSNNANVKHITPLTAIESPTDLFSKRIQFQLEESFFNSQPVSVRKTVEFISERVASACVKEICNDIVPAYKKDAILELRNILSPMSLPDTSRDDANRIMMVNLKMSQFATICLQNLRTQIEGHLKAMTNTRIFPAVDALLATDVLRQTKDVCVTIAIRTCLERVQQWINSHVNLGIFTKDFDGEVRRLFTNVASKHTKPKPVFVLPMFGKNVEHNACALSGVKIVENIRSFSWAVNEKPHSIRADMVLELIDSVSQSIQQRCDVNEYILALISKMLVDLALLLITHRPDVMLDDAVIRKFLLIWGPSSSTPNDLFKTLICPRNVMLLTQSANIDTSWSCLQQFGSILLREKLLTRDMLEMQVVAVCKQISDSVTLTHVTNCLRSIIADDSKTGER